MKINGLLPFIPEYESYIGKPIKSNGEIVGVVTDCKIFEHIENFVIFNALVLDERTQEDIGNGNLKFTNTSFEITNKKEDQKDV